MSLPRSSPVWLIVPAPCEWLSANDRLHWAHKARVTKSWREAGMWAAKRARIRCFGDTPVHITATVHKTHGRKYDAGNLAPTAKAIVDGLRDAGVLVDDDNDHVIGPDMRRGDKTDEPTVFVELRPIEVAS